MTTPSNSALKPHIINEIKPLGFIFEINGALPAGIGYNVQRYLPSEYYHRHIDGGSHPFAARATG